MAPIAHTRLCALELFTHDQKHRHIAGVGLAKRITNNRIEQYHDTWCERDKTQRGLEIEDSPFIKGHQLYYNFIRGHDTLFGDTPGEVAGIHLNLGSNEWEKLLLKSVKNEI